MAWYRLKSDVKRTELQEYAEWLEDGTSYYGFALLFAWQEPRVRLYHPEGAGSTDLPREKVEPCGAPQRGRPAAGREEPPGRSSAASFS